MLTAAARMTGMKRIAWIVIVSGILLLSACAFVWLAFTSAGSEGSNGPVPFIGPSGKSPEEDLAEAQRAAAAAKAPSSPPRQHQR
jgi:hypothetical protein